MNKLFLGLVAIIGAGTLYVNSSSRDDENNTLDKRTLDRANLLKQQKEKIELSLETKNEEMQEFFSEHDIDEDRFDDYEVIDEDELEDDEDDETMDEFEDDEFDEDELEDEINRMAKITGHSATDALRAINDELEVDDEFVELITESIS